MAVPAMNYHGEIMDRDGGSFAEVGSENSSIYLKIMGAIFCMTVREAREIARHLNAATEPTLTPHEREP
jgi:hypothetical protein